MRLGRLDGFRQPHTSEDPRPTGPIGWVRRVFQPPIAPCSADPGASVHDDDSFSFTTPAQGDAFDFTVDVHCSWCAEGDRDSGGLRADIVEQRPLTQRRIRETVRAVARLHPPFRASGAEEAVNHALASDLIGPVHHCDDVIVRCTARAEIAPAEAVRDQQQDLVRRMLEVEAQAELTGLRVTKMSELRDRWLRFFDEREDDWRVRYAVQLAEYPQDVWIVMTNMLNERRGEANRLLEMVDQIVGAQKTTNVFDLVVGSETVLRSTLEMLGIPVPPPPSDSPFAPLGEAR